MRSVNVNPTLFIYYYLPLVFVILLCSLSDMPRIFLKTITAVLRPARCTKAGVRQTEDRYLWGQEAGSIISHLGEPNDMSHEASGSIASVVQCDLAFRCLLSPLSSSIDRFGQSNLPVHNSAIVEERRLQTTKRESTQQR